MKENRKTLLVEKNPILVWKNHLWSNQIYNNTFKDLSEQRLYQKLGELEMNRELLEKHGDLGI